MCGDDLTLRADIDSLLLIATREIALTGALLGSPAGVAEDLAGQTYGHFRLTQRIGEGGMGVVYRAERTDEVQQSVAVKLISAAVGKAGQARFEREAQLLAQIEHPAVARLVDVGVEHGRAWIAMEFVNGLRIDDYCRAKDLRAGDIVGLLAQLAGAVATAHRMLVVHNDIKPANVLVTADGVPKLIDFGISRALQEANAPAPGAFATVGIGRLFSPGFAAPEQINGGPITVATDVFGLGALAYRLLTGHSTFPDAVEPLDYMLAIAQRDVELPSRAALKAGRALEARQLRGDLDAILCKALERDPARRYVSVEELQGDLKAYLAGRPVKARSATLPYRWSKFARRHRWGLGISALAAVGLLVIGGIYAAQERRVDQALHAAARRGEFLQSLLKSANPRDGKRDATVADMLDQAADQVASQFSKEPLVAASMLELIANTDFNLGRLAKGLEVSDRQIDLLRHNHGSPLDLADALSIRGELLVSSGKDAEAQIPLREALALVDQRRGAERPLARALDGLAKACLNLGNWGEAEALYQREIGAIASIREPLGAAAGFPYAGLGSLRHAQGRYAESVAYLAKALEIARATFLPDHPDHPDLLDAEYNYAALLEATHQADKAEPLFRHLLEAYRRVMGPQNYETYGAQAGLAHDLLSLKRYPEAAEEAHQAALGLSAIVGENERWTMKAWDVFGLATCLAGNGEEGLRDLRRVRDLHIRQTGADSWLAMISNIHIGTCLVSLQRYAEAEPVLLNTIESWQKTHDDRDNAIQEGFQAMSDLYAATGRPQQAEVWRHKISRDPK
jgi:serine/threonine protein kinase